MSLKIQKSFLSHDHVVSSKPILCPLVEADLTKLPTARIDKKLKGLVTLVDNDGFGLNLKGDIINIDDTLASIEAAERLGMMFARKE